MTVGRRLTPLRLYPYHLPHTPEWEEKKDLFGQSAMMGAGAGMFIKNPLWVSLSKEVCGQRARLTSWQIRLGVDGDGCGFLC